MKKSQKEGERGEKDEGQPKKKGKHHETRVEEN